MFSRLGHQPAAPIRASEITFDTFSNKTGQVGSNGLEQRGITHQKVKLENRKKLRR